jgi:cephalosporin-C deacetylase
MKLSMSLLIFIASIIISCNSYNDGKPKDFDSFWEDTVNELGTTVVSERLRDTIVNDKKWSLFKIKSFNDVYIHAWVSEPLVSGKFPIKIKFSGFGEGETNRNKVRHPWFLKQKNSINMIVDIRGQGLSQEQIKYKGYLTNALNDKENYIYRGAYMDAVKAVDFIALNPKRDGNLIVSGGSQGGTLSILAAALNPKVTMCVVGFPFLTDIENYDKKEWPMKIIIHEAKRKEIDLNELKHTLSYFDMLNFADKINAPIFIRTQETDIVTPKEGAVKFFNKTKSNKKKIYIEPCEGHGCSSKSKKANDLERTFIKANMLSN